MSPILGEFVQFWDFFFGSPPKIPRQEFDLQCVIVIKVMLSLPPYLSHPLPAANCNCNWSQRCRRLDICGVPVRDCITHASHRSPTKGHFHPSSTPSHACYVMGGGSEPTEDARSPYHWMDSHVSENNSICNHFNTERQNESGCRHSILTITVT